MATSKQGKSRKKSSAKAPARKAATVKKATPNKPLKTKYTDGLEKARKLFEQKKYEEALEASNQFFTDDILKSDPQAYYFAGRLSAFAAASLNRIDTAIEFANKVLAQESNLLDFHYLLTYCRYKTGQWEMVRKHADSYFKLVEKQKKSKKPVLFYDTLVNQVDVFNYLALSCKELNDFDDAETAFKNAIICNDEFTPSYLHYAQMLHGLKRDQEACAVLQSGVDAVGQNPDFEMLLKAYAPRPSISVCMIVKNEEKYLDNCLKSLKGFADEIIIVDTGSTDSTVEIAESHGARVYYHEWENDFSKARNYSLSYATGEWIFIIDADEELVREDIPLLKEAAEQTANNVISVNVYNLGSDKRMESASFLPSIRMFRRKIGACYFGIVHNQLFFNTEREVVLRIGVRIKHYGYGLDPESMKRKHDRSRALLLQQIEENPDNAFAHFNLAQLYRGESNTPSPENCHQVIGHAQKVLSLTDPSNKKERGIHLMALHQMTTAYQFLGEFDKAIEYSLQALKYKPNYLDPLLSLGNNYGLKNDLKNSRKWYKKYLEVLDSYDETDETDQIIFLYLKNRHSAYYGLAVISETENKIDESIKWFRKTLKFSPDYLDSHFRLGRLLYNVGRMNEALEELHKEIARKPSNWAAYYISGEIQAHQKNFKKAQEYFETGLQYAPGDPNLLYSLAKVLRDNNKSEQALEYLDKLADTNTKLYEFYRLMGDIQFEQGNFAEAASAYTNYAIRFPENCEVWNNLGNAHFKLEEFEQARDCYQKAIEIDRSFSLAFRNLAVTQVNLQENEKALEILEEYIPLADDDFDLLRLAADLARNIQNYSKAIKYYEKCLQFQPESVELITALSDCYRDSGNIESARMGYKQALNINPDFKAAKTRLDTIDALSSFKK